jgi:GR25 family glycosyltransferase involved in LPS biosynthesis
LKIYKYIIDNQIQAALILEDDIQIKYSIDELISIETPKPTNWKILMLCYYRNNSSLRNYIISPKDRQKISNKFKVGKFTENMHSSAAYLLSNEGALELQKQLTRGISMPIDHYIGDYSRPGLYALLPKPIEIDLYHGFKSSIAVDRAKLSTSEAKKDYAQNRNLRNYLKRLGLFTAAKKLNLWRIEIQKPVSQIVYAILNPKLLFRDF